MLRERVVGECIKGYSSEECKIGNWSRMLMELNCEVLNKTYKLKDSMMKIRKIIIPTVMYGSELWCTRVTGTKGDCVWNEMLEFIQMGSIYWTGYAILLYL